jgi:hypothetical protein
MSVPFVVVLLTLERRTAHAFPDTRRQESALELEELGRQADIGEQALQGVDGLGE